MKSVVFAVAGTILASGASAQLIASEAFNVPPYADNVGLNGAAGGGPGTFGWAAGSTWNVGSANWQADAISLTNGATAYDDDSTGKVTFIAAGGPAQFFRRGFRSVESYTAADTYYMSMFLNPGSQFFNANRQYAMAGFTNFFGQGEFRNDAFSGDLLGLMAGFRGEAAAGSDTAADTTDLVIRARGASGNLEDTVLIRDAEDTTYHLIMKLEVDAAGSDDRVSWWINPFNLTDESALDASSIASGSFLSAAMESNADIVQAHLVTDGWGRNTFFDELRFGYDLDSVTGVPAPASAALLGLGGLAAARRRRA